jgi:hypothetical protein
MGNEHFYIIPVYLNCNFWEDSFSKLNNLFLENNVSNSLLIGDCNARKGNLQSIPNEIMLNLNCETISSSNRISKDEIINVKGKRLLDFCSDNSLIVLNGRSILMFKKEIVLSLILHASH